MSGNSFPNCAQTASTDIPGENLCGRPDSRILLSTPGDKALTHLRFPEAWRTALSLHRQFFRFYSVKSPQIRTTRHSPKLPRSRDGPRPCTRGLRDVSSVFRSSPKNKRTNGWMEEGMREAVEGGKRGRKEWRKEGKTRGAEGRAGRAHPPDPTPPHRLALFPLRQSIGNNCTLEWPSGHHPPAAHRQLCWPAPS